MFRKEPEVRSQNSGFSLRTEKVYISIMRRMVLLLLVAGIGCGEDGAQAQPAPEPAAPVMVDFGKLAGWEFEQGAPMPEEIQALHGKRVEIKGFIYPLKNPRNMREFLFMKDRGTCCYGAGFQWTHILDVKIPPEREAIHYTTAPVTLVGTLRVIPRFIDGYPDSLYFLEVESHRK